MQNLGAGLSVELFIKKGRGIKPTKAADRLYDHAQQILRDVETARLSVQATQDSPVGQLNLAATDQIGRIFLAQTLSRFSELYPQVRVSIWEGMGSTVYEWLLSGVVDLGFISAPPPSPTITKVAAVYDNMMVAVSNDWRNSNYAHLVKDEFSLADLAELPLILPRKNTGHRMAVDLALAEIDLVPNIVSEVDGVCTNRALIERNMGCSVMIIEAMQPDLQLGLLNAIPIVSPPLEVEIAMLKPRDRLLTSAGRAFIEMLMNNEFEGGMRFTDKLK